MGQEQGYAFDQDSASLIADAVRRVRAMPANFPQAARVSSGPGGSVVNLVRVDAGPTSGIYTGILILPSTDGATTITQTAGDEVYIWDPNA